MNLYTAYSPVHNGCVLALMERGLMEKSKLLAQVSLENHLTWIMR